MKNENVEEIPAAKLLETAHQMREFIEGHGLKFSPDFDTVVREVQRMRAKRGEFYSFEECAYRVCWGALEANFTLEEYAHIGEV